VNEFKRDFHHPWIEDLSWDNANGPELLSSVSSVLAGSSRRAWVFDLDSTLFCVEPRTRFIFSEFLREQVKVPQEWWKLLSFLGLMTHTYSVQDMFELGFREMDSSNSEKKAKDLWKAFEPHWMKSFFIGRYMHYDQPYRGAVEFVQKVQSAGHDIVYLTGREYQKAFGATVDSLKQWGFPTGPDIQLILKPWQWRHLSDFEYKDRACSIIASQYNVVCSVDNEPENLLAFAKNFPAAHLALFHSVMSKRRPSTSDERVLAGRKLIKLFNY